jgi:hypothetical protein
MTAKKKVETILNNEGSISRNRCIQEKITTRLAAIIGILKQEGYSFTTKETESDFVYIKDGGKWNLSLSACEKKPEEKKKTHGRYI